MSAKAVRQGLTLGALLVSGSLPLVAIAAVLWGIRLPAPTMGPFSFWTALCLLAATEGAAGFALASSMLKKACAMRGTDYNGELKALILSFPLPIMWATRFCKAWEAEENRP